jgi:hypothetical protein
MEQRLRVLRFLVTASCKFVGSLLKNGVKILIGREARFDERGLFLWQLVLHLTGLRPIRRITCKGFKREGAGSHALMTMKAIMFARSTGLTYLHTPFSLIHHADRPMHEWITAWETLFNLGAGELPCDSPKHGVVNYRDNMAGLELCFGWRERQHELPDLFKTVIPELRRRYYLKKSPRTTEDLTVAVHIRRGDVSDRNPGYFTSTDIILRTTTAVKSILETHSIKYRMGVYSNGTSAECAEFSLLGAELYVDADAIWTIQELIEADILVMAKGCFSAYAALVSDGIRLFEPKRSWGALTGKSFDPTSWPRWLPCLADGSFDQLAFERQLLLLIDAKAARRILASPHDSDQGLLIQQSVFAEFLNVP